jgi:hypothetical protein
VKGKQFFQANEAARLIGSCLELTQAEAGYLQALVNWADPVTGESSPAWSVIVRRGPVVSPKGLHTQGLSRATVARVYRKLGGGGRIVGHPIPGGRNKGRQKAFAWALMPRRSVFGPNMYQLSVELLPAGPSVAPGCTYQPGRSKPSLEVSAGDVNVSTRDSIGVSGTTPSQEPGCFSSRNGSGPACGLAAATSFSGEEAERDPAREEGTGLEGDLSWLDAEDPPRDGGAHG